MAKFKVLVKAGGKTHKVIVKAPNKEAAERAAKAKVTG